MTSSIECKECFDEQVKIYMKLTELVLDIDKERTKIITNFAAIQKLFKSYNTTKKFVWTDSKVQKPSEIILDSSKEF